MTNPPIPEGALDPVDGKRRRWACGDFDSDVPKETTDLPLCLTLKTSNLLDRDGPGRSMCLELNDGEWGREWCYNRMPWFTYGCSYCLWWSPSEACDTAWRMHDYIDNDQSDYKLPTPEYDTNTTTTTFVPDWNATDFTNGWLHWNDNTMDWESIAMAVEPCEDPLRECVVDFTDRSGYVSRQSDPAFMNYCRRMDTMNQESLGIIMDGGGDMMVARCLVILVMAGVCVGGALIAVVCSIFGGHSGGGLGYF